MICYQASFAFRHQLLSTQLPHLHIGQFAINPQLQHASQHFC